MVDLSPLKLIAESHGRPSDARHLLSFLANWARGDGGGGSGVGGVGGGGKGSGDGGGSNDSGGSGDGGGGGGDGSGARNKAMARSLLDSARPILLVMSDVALHVYEGTKHRGRRRDATGTSHFWS